MCNLKLENTVTFNIKLITGQQQYTLSNIRRLDGRKVLGIAFLDPTDVAKSSTGVAMASLACVKSGYLSLMAIDGQTLVLDSYPVKNLIVNSDYPKIQTIEPLELDTDKSYVLIPDDTTITNNNGKVVTCVIYYESKNCK